MFMDLKNEVLEILFNDARSTPEEIAIMTNRPQADIIKVIKQLEDDKIIVKYPALINWDKVDAELVQALIEVRVTPQRDEGFDAIAERIYRFDEVSSVYLMSGAYDLMVIVDAKSMKQLAMFVAQKLSTVEHVLSTATHFILKKYKSEGVIFEERANKDRLVISL